jgi:DNA-binding NarL/FixJ family response regulator
VPIRIIIADSNYLSRKGMAQLVAGQPAFELIAEVSASSELTGKLDATPDLLIFDFTSATFSIEDIAKSIAKFPLLKILVITPPQSKPVMLRALELGAISYLLKDCGREEIIEAIMSTSQGKKFFCGKIFHTLTEDPAETVPMQAVSCEGINVTEREAEIIRLVAEGYSNKQIADKLFLSAHTVTTHRKNIMNKLGINNTAGLVLYAVRENIISPNPFLFSGNNTN